MLHTPTKRQVPSARDMNKQHAVNATRTNTTHSSSYVSFVKTPVDDGMLPFSRLDCRANNLHHIAVTVQFTYVAAPFISKASDPQGNSFKFLHGAF